MRKRFGIFLATATLALASTTVPAALTIVEQAYEISPGQVSLPVTATGRLTLSPCSGCKSVTLQVNEETRYQIGIDAKGAVTLADMQQAIRAPGADRRLLVILYLPKSNIVTRIMLSAG